MSGARYLPRTEEPRAIASPKYLALAILTLEPTLAVKGNSSCFIACFGKREEHGGGRRRVPSSRTPEPEGVSQGVASEGCGLDRRFKRCEEACRELKSLTEAMEAYLKARYYSPQVLLSLVEHFKEMFLKSCGLSVVDVANSRPFWMQGILSSDTPWFVGRSVLPSVCVTMLEECSMAIRGRPITDLDKETVCSYLSEVGLEEWLVHLGYNLELARSLQDFVTGKKTSTNEFEKLTIRYDGQLRSQYREILMNRVRVPERSVVPECSANRGNDLLVYWGRESSSSDEDCPTPSRWSIDLPAPFRRSLCYSSESSLDIQDASSPPVASFGGSNIAQDEVISIRRLFGSVDSID